MLARGTWKVLNMIFLATSLTLLGMWFHGFLNQDCLYLKIAVVFIWG